MAARVAALTAWAHAGGGGGCNTACSDDGGCFCGAGNLCCLVSDRPVRA
jgi:hypothetical protein